MPLSMFISIPIAVYHKSQVVLFSAGARDCLGGEGHGRGFNGVDVLHCSDALVVSVGSFSLNVTGEGGGGSLDLLDG